MATRIQKIDVNIHSPSSEINNPLSFTSLPITTTVAELKQRIQDAVPTRPTFERQRLIYRGKMLGTGSATLKDVFGQEALDDPGTKSLHLVLMPTVARPTSRDGSAQHPGSGSSLRNGSGSYSPTRARSEGGFHQVVDQNPTRHQPNHRAYNNVPLPAGAFPAGALPPELQAHLALHNATIAQALGQPLAQGPAPPQSFEQLVAQQQQQRASAGLPGLGGPTPVGGNGTDGSGNATAPNQEAGSGWRSTNSTTTTNTPTGSSVTREVQGPNGEIVRMITVRGNISGSPLPQDNDEEVTFVIPATVSEPNTAPNPTPPHQPQAPHQGSTTANQPHPSTQQQSFLSISQPSPIAWLLSDANGPHAILQAPSGLYTSPSAERHFNHFFHPFIPIPPATPTSAPDGQPRNRGQPNRAPPNQPQFQQNLQDIRARIHQYQQHRFQLPAQAPQAEHHNNEINNNNQRQQVQANNPNNNDLARQLVPLAGHLWLLVRLIGFVYFFGVGASWRRIFILGTLALLAFFKQTGLLEGLQHALWDPIRHHLEGLVPLDNNNRRGANNNNANNAPNIPGAEGNAGVGNGNGNGNGEGGEPDPRLTAERLVREREERDRGWIRRRLRAVERAVAIFVASLIPGVGERHIAAREAAEAVRLVEEREREEERERLARDGGNGGEGGAEGEGEGASGGGEGVEGGVAGEGGEGEGARDGEREGPRQEPPLPQQPFLQI